MGISVGRKKFFLGNKVLGLQDQLATTLTQAPLALTLNILSARVDSIRIIRIEVIMPAVKHL